ncbi:MAG: biotin/lipoyl-binding protein, partial [Eggerthellaceae bacterium]|nr:biotin/lipoyl-binding protein [Eggerthellaceae bacterium]
MPDHTNSEIGTSEHPTPPWPNGQPSPQPNSATHAPLPAQGAPSLPVSRDGAFEGDAEALNAYRTLEARKKRRRRNRIIAGCVVGALALAGIGWWLSNSLSQATSSESSEASFSVEQVTEGTFESSVSASGAIKPASQVVVTPEVDGIVENVLVAEGDLVQAGDVLFTLRNASLDKAVQDAEQALKTAENNVASSQNALDSAVNAQARAQESYDKVFSTEYETQEEADAAGNQATDALSSANNAVRDAQLALDNAQLAVTTAREAL